MRTVIRLGLILSWFVLLVVIMLNATPQPTLATPACTPPPGYPRYTLVQHVMLSPVIAEGLVVTTALTSSFFQTATVNVSNFYKQSGATTITVTNLGPASLCLITVDVGERYIFFLNKSSETDFIAHYLDPHDAVVAASAANRMTVTTTLANLRSIYLPVVER